MPSPSIAYRLSTFLKLIQFGCDLAAMSFKSRTEDSSPKHQKCLGFLPSRTAHIRQWYQKLCFTVICQRNSCWCCACCDNAVQLEQVATTKVCSSARSSVLSLSPALEIKSETREILYVSSRKAPRTPDCSQKCASQCDTCSMFSALPFKKGKFLAPSPKLKELAVKAC